MSIFIYPVEQHIKGGFNDGEILENKPIQFSEDDSKLKPYSNIFYWAHAWSDNGSLIGEHPHQVFEIMSFIIKGEIEHYDSKNRSWLKLKAGDVQIIRAGSGISHAEKLGAGAQMFQIWLDPEIEKTIRVPATYNDYASDVFPVTKENGMTEKLYASNGAPVEMVTPGITIKEISFDAVEHKLALHKEKVYSIYIIDGEIETNVGRAKQNDFIVVRDETEFRFKSPSSGRLFMIESPAKVPYKTYVERYS
jgi:redox-sensitive bicupin YhaK (pirin superfamily)